MLLSGNTILITGGTAGIGLELGLRLSGMGNKIVLAGRRTSLLDQIAADHPDIDVLVLDVADPTSIKRAYESVAVSHPALNVVINNAGIMLHEDLLDPSWIETAEQHVETNLLGTLRMTHAFLPLLSGKDNAAIITVTSSLAFVPYSVTPTYSATKAALHSFSDSLRVQLDAADTGVQVIEVVPPQVRTTLLGQQDDDNAMPVDEFVTEVLDLLRADPHTDEVVVERAKFLREAPGNGTYNDVLAMLSR